MLLIKPKLSLVMLAWFCSAMAWAVPPVTKHLQLLTEDKPPFSFYLADKRVGGTVTDVIKELFKLTSISYSIELMPWLRAYNETLLKENTCLFSTIRTEQRESKFKWVGPLIQNPWVLFGRKGEGAMTISSLEEAQRYKIGGYTGDAVAQYLIANHFNVELATSDELNIKKLVAGHIDFWATNKSHGEWMINKDDYEDKVKPVLVLDDTYRSAFYLACNKSVPDAVIRQLNELLRDIRCKGMAKNDHIFPMSGERCLTQSNEIEIVSNT